MFRNNQDTQLHALLADLRVAIKNRDQQQLQTIAEKYIKSQNLTEKMGWGQWLGYGVKSLVTQWKWDPNGEMSKALTEALRGQDQESLDWVSTATGIPKDSLTVGVFNTPKGPKPPTPNF